MLRDFSPRFPLGGISLLSIFIFILLGITRVSASRVALKSYLTCLLGHISCVYTYFSRCYWPKAGVGEATAR